MYLFYVTKHVQVTYVWYSYNTCICSMWQNMSKLHMCDIAIIHVSVLCDKTCGHVLSHRTDTCIIAISHICNLDMFCHIEQIHVL
jgi:K+/H+ antiporter YhaU regulatory subunit KhtT